MLSPDAEEKLKAYAWPGNVRQLRNVLEAASIFSDESRITAAEIARVLDSGPGLVTPGAELAGGASSDLVSPYDAATFEEFKNQAESVFFRTRLERNGGNVKRTAEELGMQRSHLYKKLDRYDLR